MYNSLNFSPISQDPLPTRVITDPTIIVMCDVKHSQDVPFVKRGDVVTLITAPQRYGFNYYITYFLFNGERGFILEKGS